MPSEFDSTTAAVASCGAAARAAATCAWVHPGDTSTTSTPSARANSAAGCEEKTAANLVGNRSQLGS